MRDAVKGPRDFNSRPAYRIYTIDPGTHFANVEVAEYADDKEVIEKASAQGNGCAIEIWDHKRFVARFHGDDAKGNRPRLASVIVTAK